MPMPPQDGAQRRVRAVDNNEQGQAVRRKRTRARELALQFLYQWDQRGDEVRGELVHFLIEGDANPHVQSFARDLINGVIENIRNIDDTISGTAEHWELRRMAVVDRNILRLAAYELLYLADIPPKVSINEAIDLAKKFSTAESGAFVNGILDKIRKNIS